MENIKEITILVAVLNKSGTIKACVESLLKVRYPVKKVLIVDGYSNDGTYEILKGFGDKISLVQYPKNLSKTFNWALDQIDTEFTALTDGDCVVAPDWLDELIKGIDGKDVVATAGYCGTPEGLSLLQTVIGLELESRFKRFPKHITRAPTMNLCLKTEVAQKIRFDEKQGVGVEVDFGWRLSKLGKILYNPESKIFHYHRGTLKGYFNQQRNQAKWGLRLLFKHGRRAVADPITTLSMTLQIPFLSLGLFFLCLSFLNKSFLYPSIAFLLMLFIIYVKNIIEIKPPVSYYPAFGGIFILRTFAWVTGIAEGILLWPLVKKSF